MQGIYTYIPETNHVPRIYRVSAILSLLFMRLCFGVSSNLDVSWRYGQRKNITLISTYVSYARPSFITYLFTRTFSTSYSYSWTWPCPHLDDIDQCHSEIQCQDHIITSKKCLIYVLVFAIWVISFIRMINVFHVPLSAYIWVIRISIISTTGVVTRVLTLSCNEWLWLLLHHCYFSLQYSFE